MSDDDLVLISAAAAETGLTRRAIRFYEAEGLIDVVPRGDRARRLYDRDAIDLLRRIKEMKEIGLSVNEIKDALNANPGVSAKRLGRAELEFQLKQLLLQRDKIDRKIERIRAMMM